MQYVQKLPNRTFLLYIYIYIYIFFFFFFIIYITGVGRGKGACPPPFFFIEGTREYEQSDRNR